MIQSEAIDQVERSSCIYTASIYIVSDYRGEWTPFAQALTRR